MARLNHLQNPPLLDALIQQAETNSQLIAANQKSGLQDLIRQIQIISSSLKQQHDVPCSLADRQARLKKQFFCLDALFNAYLLLPGDAHFLTALKVQKLGMKTFRAFHKFERLRRYIDERNRQNDKRNSQNSISHSRESGNPSLFPNNREIPVSTGMTLVNKDLANATMDR